MPVRPPAASTGLAPGVVAVVRFTDLLANGQAVGRLNGFVMFVSGPLPGERARVRVIQVKPKYAVGEVVAYETQSEYRAKPFCGVFGVCGGCQVQHLAYPAQLAWKEQIVRNALRRIGGFADVDVRRPVGMTHPRNYRNKMALVVDQSSGETAIWVDQRLYFFGGGATCCKSRSSISSGVMFNSLLRAEIRFAMPRPKAAGFPVHVISFDVL